MKLVAFPQDGFLRSVSAPENLRRAIDLGGDVVGGITHFVRRMAVCARYMTALRGVAAERDLRVDMHCNQTDDPCRATSRRWLMKRRG